MLRKFISNTVSLIVGPKNQEIINAQEDALERIQTTLQKAEAEVAWAGAHMTPEQRLQAAEKELAKTEEFMLSALGSMFKVLLYITPDLGGLLGRNEKAVNGEVISYSHDPENKG